MTIPEVSEVELIDTLNQFELPVVIGHPGRRDLIDNSFSMHKFKYALNRNKARQFPELLRDFADDLEDWMTVYGGKGERYGRMAQILAKGAEEHINALIERLEYKENVTSFHDMKVKEAARLAVAAVAKLQAGSFRDLPSMEYLDNPQGFYVYVLWGDEGPVYVGKSTNILSRPGQHMNDPKRREATKRVQFIEYDEEDTMTAAESALIKAYRPRFNIMGNPDARR